MSVTVLSSLSQDIVDCSNILHRQCKSMKSLSWVQDKLCPTHIHQECMITYAVRFGRTIYIMKNSSAKNELACTLDLPPTVPTCLSHFLPLLPAVFRWVRPNTVTYSFLSVAESEISSSGHLCHYCARVLWGVCALQFSLLSAELSPERVQPGGRAQLTSTHQTAHPCVLLPPMAKRNVCTPATCDCLEVF